MDQGQIVAAVFFGMIVLALAGAIWWAWRGTYRQPNRKDERPPRSRHTTIRM